MKTVLPCLVFFSPFVAFPSVVLLFTSCFSPLFLTSAWLKLGPHLPHVSNQFPVEQHTMENSHGREVHYHLARALMHMITLLVSFLSLNHQWTGTIILTISMVVPAGHLPKLGTFIPSCPSHRPHQFPLWSVMEACRHIWL